LREVIVDVTGKVRVRVRFMVRVRVRVRDTLRLMLALGSGITSYCIGPHRTTSNNV